MNYEKEYDTMSESVKKLLDDTERLKTIIQ